MKYKPLQTALKASLEALARNHGLKTEHVITSPISRIISTDRQPNLLNFASHDYLGLANHPLLSKTAKEALKAKGFGLSSVRFICGTTDSHKALEAELSQFFGTEDTILFPSAYAANSAIFEVLLTEEDAVFTDELCHESVGHGIRLSKARHFVFKNNDPEDLKRKIESAGPSRFKLITSSSIFSATGELAQLPELVAIAQQNEAILMLDESHGTGVLGPSGRGLAEHAGFSKDIEIITSSLEKALGGVNGGFVTGRQEVIDILRQRARPYLFSNSISSYTVEGARAALRVLIEQPELVRKVQSNIARFRKGAAKLGLKVLGDPLSPICPIVLSERALAERMAEKMIKEGVFVLPVQGKSGAALRVQITAALTEQDIDACLATFERIWRVNGLI